MSLVFIRPYSSPISHSSSERIAVRKFNFGSITKCHPKFIIDREIVPFATALDNRNKTQTTLITAPKRLTLG